MDVRFALDEPPAGLLRGFGLFQAAGSGAAAAASLSLLDATLVLGTPVHLLAVLAVSRGLLLTACQPGPSATVDPGMTTFVPMMCALHPPARSRWVDRVPVRGAAGPAGSPVLPVALTG